MTFHRGSRVMIAKRLSDRGPKGKITEELGNNDFLVENEYGETRVYNISELIDLRNR